VLSKVQTIGLKNIANAFDSKAQVASSLRRIQHFIAKYDWDSDLIKVSWLFNSLRKRDVASVR
jgi:hypothetical protein